MREDDRKPQGGHSRRDFLRGSGAAAATALLTAPAADAAAEINAQGGGPQIVQGSVAVTLKVNGADHSVSIEPRCTLLDTLRNRLDVTGPKRVCDRASCGACTVILDGEPVYSCTTLAITCGGQEIRTLESFDEEGVPAAFHRNDGLMCGYCTPGFVTACAALLEKNSNPTLDEVKRGLDGNICRCGTYGGVFAAALDAAKAMRKEA
jgi:aerobic-type carbon monoxide dehydrogenase small subunit (CoxS/CutS family)